MSKKYVYLFTESDASMRNLLGGKGANLGEMLKLGLPVPEGFTVSTEACTRFYEDGKQISKEIQAEILKALSVLEKRSGKKFGDINNPLLLSVRSGARASMPGMMDTILNLGLNDKTAEGLAKLTNNPRFAYDSYRRFIMMFGEVVMGVDMAHFDEIFDARKEEKGVADDAGLNADDMIYISNAFLKKYKEVKGEPFPQDPVEQLLAAVAAVFRSWDNPRAHTYRRLNNIPYDWGTAVNVQIMVFGNMGDDSGSGVAFSRNPATGENEFFGEYLFNAQGEDVVAGIRTPHQIAELEKDNKEVYDEFKDIAHKLEKHYKDMQDLEFTIERGKLYILQTRAGKRTAQAAIKIAVDLVKEGLLTEKEALLSLDPRQLDHLLHPAFNAKVLAKETPIGSGLAASPGAAYGRIALSAEEAQKLVDKTGEPVILVRIETSPEDIEGMHVAAGILTARGGMTSHAAVVARGMGKCCVAGADGVVINEEAGTVLINGKKFKTGDYLSLNGTTGNIYAGKIETEEPTVSGEFAVVMGWADKYRALEVRTNADNPHDAAVAKGFGAAGIGLCRTEHMFFESDRIKSVREMIVAKTVEDREKALAKLLPIQRQDFVEIYKVMDGLPVTIRFLDPPLHEFLPHTEAEIRDLAKDLKMPYEELNETVEALREINPMLGHRGVRLSLTYPEIAVMQTRAVIEAAIEVTKKGIKVKPEIMIPLVGEVRELTYVKDYVVKTADKLIKDAGVKLDYSVGTMIEIPRATLLADEIAREAEFLSFGTNDLTQMTFGFSRDDAAKFLGDYYNKQIFTLDPFAHIDQKGVGKLMEVAVRLGKEARPDIHLGICGEHGGDPMSVEFCHKIGLDYVSCSPFRVPIARLAAAQANIKNPPK